MTDAPFVCARCGAPLVLPTDAAMLDVECGFCKTRTPTPMARLAALRGDDSPRPARGSAPVLPLAIAAAVVAAIVAVVVVVVSHARATNASVPPSAAFASATPAARKAGPANAKPDAAPSIATLVAKFGGKGTNPGLFTDARTLAIDPDGNLYVGEYTSGRIQKLDENGKFLQAYEIPDRDGHKYVFGLACDFAGALYVSRVEEVLKLSVKDGTILATVKEKKRTDPKHALPDELCAKQIAVDATNDLYILSDCVPEGVSVNIENTHSFVKLDAKGKQLRHVKGVGGDVASIAVDGAGTIFVSHGFESEVSVHDTNGTFTNKWGQRGSDPGDFDGSLEAIAVDGRGHVYVIDSKGVAAFDANGKPRGRFGEWGRAIAVAPKGDVYVLENDGIIKRYHVALPQ